MAELAVGIDGRRELLGQTAPADDRAEDAARVGRIAVRVLAAARGDNDRLVHIPLAVEQSHDDVGTVDLGVDIEGAFVARGLAIIRIVLILGFDLLPCLLPVIRILPCTMAIVSRMHSAYWLSCGNALQSGFDDLHGIVFEKGFGIHAADELAAVETVAVVHQPSELLAQLDRHVRHARRDQAGVVRFDLVVDIVGMLVELRMSRIGRRDAAAQVVASRSIGVPQRIATVGEIDPRLTNRNVPAVHLQRAQERHLDIDVVLVELVDHLRLPRRESCPAE